MDDAMQVFLGWLDDRGVDVELLLRPELTAEEVEFLSRPGMPNVAEPFTWGPSRVYIAGWLS
jgi:hypothetical protein